MKRFNLNSVNKELQFHGARLMLHVCVIAFFGQLFPERKKKQNRFKDYEHKLTTRILK